MASAADDAPAELAELALPADEVAEFGGTVEEAIDAGLFDPPPALTWQRWHIWRSSTGSRPASLRIGTPGGREATIWRRVMESLHGPEWQTASGELTDGEMVAFLASVGQQQELRRQHEVEQCARASEDAPKRASPLAQPVAETDCRRR